MTNTNMLKSAQKKIAEITKDLKSKEHSILQYKLNFFDLKSTNAKVDEAMTEYNELMAEYELMVAQYKAEIKKLHYVTKCHLVDTIVKDFKVAKVSWIREFIDENKELFTAFISRKKAESKTKINNKKGEE